MKLTAGGRTDLGAGPRLHDRNDVYGTGGIAIGERGELFVVHRGLLFLLSPDLEVLKSFDLCESGLERRLSISSPAALSGGGALLWAGNRLLRLTEAGELLPLLEFHSSFDDSGFSPAIDPGGSVYLTTPSGFFLRVRDGVVLEAEERFGYDLLPPAVYPDGTLAVAGYWDVGLCRYRFGERILWKTEDSGADYLPALNAAGVLAGGFLNDGFTLFISPEGERLGSYPLCTSAAEYDRESWILRASISVSRVSSSGEVVWTEAVQDLPKESWGRGQPIVDGEGRIYLRLRQGILVLDGDGRRVGEVRTDHPIHAVAIGEGRVLYAIVGDTLVAFTDDSPAARMSHR